MKLPLSVRDLYQVLEPNYQALKQLVDARIASVKEPRWHYESRIKTQESFALKLETGRVPDPKTPDDLFACCIVVENQARIEDAEALLVPLFSFHQRKPREPDFTPLPPHSFDFDELRLYLKWADEDTLRATGCDGLIFELQIKTFLQHAWGIATHDFIYKTDSISWASSRIAYQVKAMLENAELSIAEAPLLTSSAILDKSDKSYQNLEATIGNITKRWQPALLPKDLRRLAQSIDELCKCLNIRHVELWEIIDKATAAGGGAKTLSLSPHASIIEALIKEKGAALFTPLGHPRSRDSVFVPLEIELPTLSSEISQKIIRPPSVGTLH